MLNTDSTSVDSFNLHLKKEAHLCVLTDVWLFVDPWTISCPWNFPGYWLVSCYFLLQDPFHTENQTLCLLSPALVVDFLHFTTWEAHTLKMKQPRIRFTFYYDNMIKENFPPTGRCNI